MKIRMDWNGDRYEWVQDNKIQHTVLEQVLSPVSFKMSVATIDIPDDSKDLTAYLLKWP